MRYLMTVMTLTLLTVGFVGCQTEEPKVDVKPDKQEVVDGVQEEIDRQNETMEGHGEVDVNAEEEASEIIGEDK